LKELANMDLGGAPYAYTPFCDSRIEMDGFRFWKQGYWRNHLQGRAYHISALYVVDLKRFRRIAAGDRLRGQYQALSQDPNSLANLDQVCKKYNFKIFTHKNIKIILLIIIVAFHFFFCKMIGNGFRISLII